MKLKPKLIIGLVSCLTVCIVLGFAFRKRRMQRRILDRQHAAEVESDELTEWLQNNGGEVGGVGIKLFSYGNQMVRGLVAKKDAKAGETLLTIPKSLFLLPRRAPESFDDQAILLAAEIAMHLTQGEDDQFYRYFEALPKKEDLDNKHPFYAPNEDLVLFAELPTTKTIRKERTLLREAWSSQTKGKPKEGLTWDGDYEWDFFMHCFVLQLTRRVVLTLSINGNDPKEEGDKKTQVLAVVPFMDFANFGGADTNLKLEMLNDDDAMVVKASVDVAKGQELIFPVSVAAPGQDNLKLAYRYGISLGDNPVPTEQLERDVCDGLKAAIEELHSKNDRKHQMRMLLSSLVYEACQEKKQSAPQEAGPLGRPRID